MAGGYIPETVLEQILSRIDIIELISSYIPLKRAGRNFKAPCPFHHEKTPSFVVSSDRQIYHCFGCGAGGNAFNFLMQYERLEFPEAVEMLARKSGVILPDARREDPKAANLITEIYKINELAASFFENNLNSSEAVQARNYLLKRGIKPETIKTFKLGFVADKWEALINFLKSKNISFPVMEKTGLILSKESGGYYDRFRNRIIFPILDVKSRVIAFGARLVPSSEGKKEDIDSAKYINSPETPIYTKGRHLYGLNLAKESIRENDQVAVVEGYLDFILPFQEGFQNIVASLGTALTEEQIRLIKRYTHNVVMVYDADSAGQLATLRTLDMFVEEEMDVRLASLPVGFDPDLFVRKNGVKEFKQLIDKAEDIFSYKMRMLKTKFKIKEAQGKAMISSEMLSTINKFKNEVIKSEYIKKLAQELDVKEEVLLRDLHNIKGLKKHRVQVPASALESPILNINPTEKLLIKLMLEETELINHVKNYLVPGDFQDKRVSKIVALLFNLIEEGKNVESKVLVNQFEDENVLRLVCESAFLPEVSAGEKEKVVEDCIERLKSRNLVAKKHDLHMEIKNAQDSGNEEKMNSLMQEFYYLTKRGK